MLARQAWHGTRGGSFQPSRFHPGCDRAASCMLQQMGKDSHCARYHGNLQPGPGVEQRTRRRLARVPPSSDSRINLVRPAIGAVRLHPRFVLVHSARDGVTRCPWWAQGPAPQCRLQASSRHPPQVNNGSRGKTPTWRMNDHLTKLLEEILQDKRDNANFTPLGGLGLVCRGWASRAQESDDHPAQWAAPSPSAQQPA